MLELLRRKLEGTGLRKEPRAGKVAGFVKPGELWPGGERPGSGGLRRAAPGWGVTTVQLNDALQSPAAQTTNHCLSAGSANSNAVSLKGLAVSDQSTQAEVQAVANKLDDLLLALRR